jgi:hypothetical protein
VNVSRWNAQNLIISVHFDIKADFNDIFDREYNDLNNVDIFAVDNSKVFELGVPLECVSLGKSPQDLKGYTVNGISNKLNYVCTSVKMAKSVLEKAMEEARDVYYPSKKQSTHTEPRPYIYKLKPSVNQQDVLWNIIDYFSQN